MTICDKTICTGCLSCKEVCPNSAISSVRDERGFIYPVVDSNKCIKCNLCINTCPANNKKNTPRKDSSDTFEQTVYACWSLDNNTLSNSSSGGLFYEIAKAFLLSGGIVVGAAYNESFNVCHICIGSADELYRIQGSKYVQSDLANTYSEVLSYLKNGKKVLFSGTPCQVAGLKSIVGNNSNFYSCDLICHGVPSPKFFDDYKKNISKKYNSNITEINFRDKSLGWFEFSMKINFSNGKSYCKSTYKDKFHRAFLNDFISRDCCHSCQYTSTVREGDITIADYWGYDLFNDEHKNKNRGVSQAIINSQKGQNLFLSGKDNLFCFKRTMDDALSCNKCLSICFHPNPQKEQFWLDYQNNGFTYVSKKHLHTDKRGTLLFRINYYIKCKIIRLKQKLYFASRKAIRFPFNAIKSMLGDEKYNDLKKRIKK